MNVVLASAAFWAPGTYSLMGDDGALETVNFRARFRRLKTSERRAMDSRLRANGLAPEVRVALRERLADPKAGYAAAERKALQADVEAEPISDGEFLRELLVDWDLKDKQGNPVTFSLAAMSEVCEDWDGFEAALVRAYMKARDAALNPKEVEKNSGEPSATTS